MNRHRESDSHDSLQGRQPAAWATFEVNHILFALAGDRSDRSPPGMTWLVGLGLLLTLAFLPGAPTSAAPLTKDLYFLGVGVEHYQDPLIPADPGAIRRIQGLADALEAQKGRLYETVRIAVRQGAGVSRAGLSSAVETAAQELEVGDLLVIYLSLRCVREERTQRPLLLMTNSELNNLASSSIFVDELYLWLKKWLPPATRVLVMTDTLRGLESTTTAASSPDAPALTWVEPDPLETALSHVPEGWSQLTAGMGQTVTDAGHQSLLDEDPGLDRILQTAWSGRSADKDGDALLSQEELMHFVSSSWRNQFPNQPVPEWSGRRIQGPLFAAPGMDERCNRIDDDLDGKVDEDFDIDGDGYLSKEGCPPPLGRDCDDHSVTTHPDQPDLWRVHPMDDDCDGLLDEDEPDLNDDGIPDAWKEIEFKDYRQKTLTWLAGGILLATTSALSFRELKDIQIEHHSDYSLDDLEKRKYVRLSYQTVVAGTAGSAALTISGVFGTRQIRFAAKYLRKPGRETVSRSLE